MIAVNNLEQVLRGLVFMRENEAPKAIIVRRLVVEAPRNVSRAALLPALEDQSADLADLNALRFQSVMDVLLRTVED